MRRSTVDRRRSTVLALFALALALGTTGCDEEFKPETLLSGFRVLGVRANPAELKPGQTAVLQALIVDPSRPGKRNTVLWLGCDPDPFNLGRSACSDVGELADPAALTAPSPDGGQAELPPGMHVIGFNENAAYTAPADAFAQLPESDPRRKAGTVAQVLAITVAEEVSLGASQAELAALFERVRNKEVQSVMALFRIRISEDAQANKNPELSELLVDGAKLPLGARLRLPASVKTNLTLTAPASSFEEFDQLTPDNPQPVHKTETLIAAWYSTAGRFTEARVAIGSETEELFTAPGGSAKEPVPENRSGSMFAVVRDTRGGQTWVEYPFFLCAGGLPPPEITSMDPETAPGDAQTPVTFKGTNLGSVLDVLVGGKVVTRAVYSPTRDLYEGMLPLLPPGEHAVLIRGKHCFDVPTALTFRAQ
jgi:hypothetical protein